MSVTHSLEHPFKRSAEFFLKSCGCSLQRIFPHNHQNRSLFSIHCKNIGLHSILAGNFNQNHNPIKTVFKQHITVNSNQPIKLTIHHSRSPGILIYQKRHAQGAMHQPKFYSSCADISIQ